MYWLTRLYFQRFLAFIYFIAFLVAALQFIPLAGENGLLPVRLYLRSANFWEAPSLFWLQSSDLFFSIIAWAGVILSLLALTGISEAFGIFLSVAVWLLLWIFYQSFVNVGQTWYGFGWEALLLETGFLAIFLGSSRSSPPQVIFWLLRWVLFRVMFGAGLIKLRADPCWKDLTCMYYHYETQPIPNPLSWYFHYWPPALHKASVLFTHFVELVIPFGVFGPRIVRYAAGAFTIAFQGLLILSGNLSWLNYLTIALGIACFDDGFFRRLLPIKPPAVAPFSKLRRANRAVPDDQAATRRLTNWRRGVLTALTGLILLLSIPPALNLLSQGQLMNASFEPFHLVNTYGAFGSVTKKRMEIVIEGTHEVALDPATRWREYEFKAKPGDPRRRPPIVAPYHYRLDWLMWFAAMGDFPYYPWILNLASKLLQNDSNALRLLKENPFPDRPPKYVRALLYRYHFTTLAEKRKTGNWWSRSLVRLYLPPVSLNNRSFREVLHRAGWLEKK